MVCHRQLVRNAVASRRVNSFVRLLYNMKRTSIALLILCSCLAAVPDASGQTPIKQGRCATGIEGRTTGIQGWIIVGATIRLTNRKTKQATDVKTDANGEYVACLSSGTYDLIANASKIDIQTLCSKLALVNPFD